MTTLIKSHLETPVESIDDLIAYLARGARPAERWGIGLETEKLVVDATTGEAAPYARVEELLQRLEAAGGWRGVREDGHLIALIGADSSITLEPGGQLELSGRLCPDVHCCQGDLAAHIAQVVSAAQPLGLAFLGLGVQPFTPLERIDWIPKARYGIMGPYMERTGDLGQAMMKQSAGLQVNIDFADEADCIDKMRTGLLLAPLLYALFANSPLQNGRPTGFLSTRGEIWQRTDPDRTGLLPTLFAPDAGYRTFVDYALDVPMYFIARGGSFLGLTRERFTFRRFLSEGFGEHRPTLEDWDLHLSTLFPEVRLRPQIEVRCVDSLPPRLVPAFPALVKGVLYDAEARATVRHLFGAQSPEEREALYRASWRLGLQAPFGSSTLGEAAREVLRAARCGLLRQGEAQGRGCDECVFLEEAEEIATSGRTLAERLLERWQGDRAAKVRLLREHCGY